MKAIVLLTLILTAVASFCIAAETRMTIRTDTTVGIDPITGDVKGGGFTEIKAVKVDPPPATTSSTAASSTDTTSASATGTSSTGTSLAPTSSTGTP